jgi:hypothetical protein
MVARSHGMKHEPAMRVDPSPDDFSSAPLWVNRLRSGAGNRQLVADVGDPTGIPSVIAGGSLRQERGYVSR